jgi:hypothetical protein
VNTPAPSCRTTAWKLGPAPAPLLPHALLREIVEPGGIGCEMICQHGPSMTRAPLA